MDNLADHIHYENNMEVDSTISKLRNFQWKRHETFVLIEASKLSLEDDFLKYEPKTVCQEQFRIKVRGAIRRGVKDFWKPRMDPSFNAKGDGITFEFFRKPAVGKTYKWWKRAAKKYSPARKSRLGTEDEYVAFLAVLMKLLLANGWPIEEVWSAICDDSSKLGQYLTKTEEESQLQYVGTKEIYGFFDLGNTHKMLHWNGESGGLCLAGGCFEILGSDIPLATVLMRVYFPNVANSTVGWVVLSK